MSARGFANVSSSIRSVLDLLDSPVWIVTSSHAGTAGGFVATFVMNASIVVDEPRMIVGVARHHFTHDLIRNSGRLGMHLVAADDAQSVVHFGLQSGHESRKFPWQGVVPTGSSPPHLPSSVGSLLADVETRLNIGDRTLFVCRTVDGTRGRDHAVMTMSRLLPQLTKDQRQQLQTQLIRDADTDRRAIREWRAQRDSAGGDDA